MKNILLLLLIFSSTIAGAQTDKKEDEKVSESDVQEALKETLTMGVEESAKDLSGGKIINSNSLFGLDIPAELKKMGDALSDAGKSDELHDFEESLNSAVASIFEGAKGVFDDAINNITIYDAYAVLNKGNNAATDYLKKHSGDQIKNALEPIVEKSLTSSGALDKWSQLVSQYSKLTGKEVDFNIVDYISGEAVDDMFAKLAKEEAKIRLNSYLWGSLIMKEVFHRGVR